MNSSPSKLHAYIDGELSEEDHAQVAEWLASHPEEALRASD